MALHIHHVLDLLFFFQASINLHQRVAYARDCHGGDLSPPLSYSPSPMPWRPSSYQNWRGSASIIHAVKAVQSGEVSLRRASELYGVPRATLHDHVTGKVKPDSMSGPERYLTVQEEEEQVNFLIGTSRIGYSRTRPQVLAIVVIKRMLKKWCLTVGGNDSENGTRTLPSGQQLLSLRLEQWQWIEAP